VKLVCEKHQMNKTDVVCVGNDYNDVDMLEWCPNSYVVANAPRDLRQLFQVCTSNQHSGVSDAVNQHLQFTAS